METHIEQIQKLVDEMLQGDSEIFCVAIKIKPTNNIKLYLDGDNGITIERCIYYNRKLYKLIEEKQWFAEGDFSLEVSSPGIDEPLKLNRQYKKNIGRDLEIVFTDDTKKEGKLIAVTDDDITVELTEGKGKKAITQQMIIAFANIKKAVVQVKW